MENYVCELGDLADPSKYQEPININGIDTESLLVLLKKMILIRSAEDVIAGLIEQGEACGPCHLGNGQEAIAAGVMSKLRKTDRVFGTHRAHAHFLAMNDNVGSLLAEILGRKTGCSNGIGGSQHLYDQANGFYGSVPIVGGTVPLAVGAGLAAKMDCRGDVAVCFFGDGAAEEGVVHESLNLASVYSVPILFVCENNLYSSHLDIKMRQPSDRVSRYADAHKIRNRLEDGNDVLAVQRATSELLGKIRAGEGAGFLEVVTYRWRGHVGAREDIDVGVRRDAETLIEWKKRDPIRRLVLSLIARGDITEGEFMEVQKSIQLSVQEAKQKALLGPYPDVSELLKHVYLEGA
ncbi:MAG: thiamine pyrophosphate-dependent dehydrogenase E1 component subunit alpha [Coxiellaceae bacterium]|nr:thiamine pyrophosphate-dependent dehydrogenase E1 component subunit alpha [Coxiellaceae bacterium]